MLCRIELWDCFGAAITSFNGSHVSVAQEAGSKFIPPNISIVQFITTLTQSQEKPVNE